MCFQCPSVSSSGFARHLREAQPEVPVHLSLPSGDHLFDVDTSKDADWVWEGAQFLENFWP